MDALRKAEEAKKKAEQGDDDKPEQKAADQDSAPTSGGADPEPVAESSAAREAPEEPLTETPEETPKETLEETATESRSIPDVSLEFEPEPEPRSSAEIPPGESSEPPNKAEVAGPESRDGGLSLEPIDQGLSQATRKQFDVDVTPDYSAQLSNKPVQTAGQDEAGPIPTLQRTDESVVDQSSGIEVRADSAEAKESEEVEAASAQDQANDELPVYVPQEPEPVPTKSANPKAKSKAKLKLSPKQPTIQDRADSERRGAQSLFAAKKQGKLSRIRIRRSTKIWAAQIAIGLMLMVGAYFYFFVINTTTDSFNVPEQYLVNQEQFSENFNESIAPLDNPVEDDELLSLEEQLAAQDLEFEILEEPTASADLDAVLADLDEELSRDTAQATVADVSQEPATASSVTQEVAEQAQETTVEIADAQPDVAQATDNDAANVPATASNENSAVTAPGTQRTQLVSSQGSTNSISFSRTQTAPSIDPVLRDAYSAFQRDNLVVAQDLYRRVLAESPRNRDALLGLAAIANRNGETRLAMELYSRLLARDPSDAVARAGLLGLRPVGGPEQQERELRRLIELQPQVAPVVYALGNFYAAQDRWRDAQRYYFDALQQAKTDSLQGVPVNPDYAFNLAVSLEHLNESALAETYYREAIAYAAEFPAGFDVSIARERLLSLAEVSAR